MAKKTVPNIAEKVRFWEEQDKINLALIPRVIELHESVCELHKRTADITGQIAAAEARVLKTVGEKYQKKMVLPSEHLKLVAYAALVLSFISCALSIFQLVR
ncbi:MAG: hypothetical protein M5R41_19205 [Bacteroidia bacterium]|nr:hypothetical protein [Bacteroidia bacterium]